jgi:antitoxin component YwqK of YwqJK toxin-antitoxin module
MCTSCGKNRVITGQGYTVSYSDTIRWQTYTENDSFFKTFRIKKGPVFIDAAASETQFKDSTFSEKAIRENGQLIGVRYYLHGKEDGVWMTYDANGKKETRNVHKNGEHVSCEVWYPSGQLEMRYTIKNGIHTYWENRDKSGQLETIDEVLNDTVYHSRKFYENGKVKQEMTTDLKGNGTIVFYYDNGKISMNGKLNEDHPSGPYKMYTKTGDFIHDTIWDPSITFR